MQLNISRLRADDFGEYQCVLKNDLNTTVAPIYVYGKSWIFIFTFSSRDF